eukprot:601189_1
MSKHKFRQREKRRKEAIKRRLRAHDQKLIKRANLRAERIERLKQLVAPPVHMIEEGPGADQMEEGPGADKVEEGSGASMIEEGPGADKMEVDGPPSGDESPVQNGMDDSTEGINEEKRCNEKPAKRRKTEDNQSEAEKSTIDLDPKAIDSDISRIRTTDGARTLNYPRSCYTCKKKFVDLHNFYDQLCPPCAELNFAKRNAKCDLAGAIVLVTGARVKIGYQCGLRMLRCGASLIATSRFPNDCVERYSKEDDFGEWKDRLHVFGLDLRDLKSVVAFCALVSASFPHLDAIINNAAQTIRRPPAYYQHLMDKELDPSREVHPELQKLVKGDPHALNDMPAHMKLSAPTHAAAGHTVEAAGAGESRDDLIIQSVMGVGVGSEGNVAGSSGSRSAALSQLPVLSSDLAARERKFFPKGHFDVTGQQLDLRRTNSWLLLLDQVEPGELVEVFAINALSPFIINSRLKHMMTKPDRKELPKFVINVSAMEGKFYRHKQPTHPHTNMAKAALNMLTRTSAQDYKKDKIYMNSVDTGWINDENPFFKAQRVAKRANFQTPIDEVDAMARIVDPIMIGINEKKFPCGMFFKDFEQTE